MHLGLGWNGWLYFCNNLNATVLIMSANPVDLLEISRVPYSTKLTESFANTSSTAMLLENYDYTPCGMHFYGQV